MASENINCIDCKQQFELTDDEKKWFLNKGWTPPRRCKACRQKRKADKAKVEAKG